MITKFARLEFKLFTKPSKSDFLRDHQALTLEELDDAGQIVSIMISIPLYATFLMTESTYKAKRKYGWFPL